MRLKDEAEAEEAEASVRREADWPSSGAGGLARARAACVGSRVRVYREGDLKWEEARSPRRSRPPLPRERAAAAAPRRCHVHLLYPYPSLDPHSPNPQTQPQPQPKPKPKPKP